MASRTSRSEVSDAGFFFDAGQLSGMMLGERYRIDDVLASGGMGLVCRGTDQRTERPVAVKLLKPHSGMEERTVRRFFREVEIASRLRHPHIVDVLDYGTIAGGSAPFLVMELLTGHALDVELAERQRLSAEEALELLLPIMGALASVHAAGVVHRDVKPANIFLHRDPYGRVTPKLLDFGIAKKQGSETHTSTNALMGTPAYMAPEQLGNQEVGPRTDVWAMGAVFYRCLSGTPPLAGETPAQTIARVATELAPPLDVDGLHRGLSAAIDRALLRDPNDRYADMSTFCAALVSSAHAAGLSAEMPVTLGLPADGVPPTVTDRTVSLHLPDGPDATVDTMEVGGAERHAAPARRRWGVTLGAVTVASALALIAFEWRAAPSGGAPPDGVSDVEPSREAAGEGPRSKTAQTKDRMPRQAGATEEPAEGPEAAPSVAPVDDDAPERSPLPRQVVSSDDGAEPHDVDPPGAAVPRPDRTTALVPSRKTRHSGTRVRQEPPAADTAPADPSPQVNVEPNSSHRDEELPVAVEW